MCCYLFPGYIVLVECVSPLLSQELREFQCGHLAVNSGTSRALFLSREAAELQQCVPCSPISARPWSMFLFRLICEVSVGRLCPSARWRAAPSWLILRFFSTNQLACKPPTCCFTQLLTMLRNAFRLQPCSAFRNWNSLLHTYLCFHD